METHVHCFGASWLDVVVDDPTGSGVVCLDGSLGLFVAHFRKELAHWDCFIHVDVLSYKGSGRKKKTPAP